MFDKLTRGKRYTLLIFVMLILSRLLFLGYAHVGQNLKYERQGYLGSDIDGEDNRLIWVWGNFDGRHYTDIAKYGYENYNFAFFPLYPLLIDAVHSTNVLNYLESGVFISIVFLLLSIILLYKISLLDMDRDGAIRAVIFLLIFPLSFYYNSVYPDALFFFLITSSMYFARSRNWLLCGVFGFFATFTRTSGVVLIPALIVEWMIQNEVKIRPVELMIRGLTKPKLLLTLTLTCLGFVAYMLYCEAYHGDAFLFQKSMSAWKQDEFVFPAIVIYRYIKMFISADPTRLNYWVAFTEFITFFLYLALSAYVAIRIRLSYAVLMFAMIIIVSFTGTLEGTPRYLLHLFPAFMALSYIFSTNKRCIAIIVAFVILGFIYTTLFTRGHFIG